MSGHIYKSIRIILKYGAEASASPLMITYDPLEMCGGNNNMIHCYYLFIYVFLLHWGRFWASDWVLGS